MRNEAQEIVCAVVMGLDDDAPYIMALATRQADRENHLAELLLNASIAEIADFYQHIILYVKEENHSAIKLFERMGFVAEPV